MVTKRAYFLAAGVIAAVVLAGAVGAWTWLRRDPVVPKMARPTASGAAVAALTLNDEQAGAYFVKLVDRARRGTPEERALAQDALRMAPASALPALRAAATASDAPVELKSILASQESARARYAADVARESAYGQSILSAYNRVGLRDPTSDPDVRAMLEALFVTPVSKPELERLTKNLQDAHSPDQLAAYALLVAASPAHQSLTDQLAVARDLKDSQYPASITLYATALAARTAYTQALPAPELVRTKFKTLIAAALRRLPELQAESLVHDRLSDILLSLVKAQAVADGSTLLAAWEKLEPGLRSALPRNAVVEDVGSSVCQSEGWRHRGDKTVGESSPQEFAAGMGLFTRSDQYCDAALAIDPAYVRPARQRLINMRHLSEPQSTILSLFRRCAELDPDSGKPVRILAEMSIRRWTGASDWQQQVWRCAKVAALSRNFAAGVPQEVSYILSRLRMDLDATEREKFWSTDEVRAIVRYVFDEALRLSPTEETAGNALLLYWFIGDGPSARRTLLKFPADFLPKGDWYWAERWPSIRQRILAIPENAAIPDQGPPTWAP